MIKRFLKKKLSHGTRKKLRRFSKKSRFLVKENVLSIKGLLRRSSLDEIGRFYRTDKVVGHSYGEPYSFHFKKFRAKRVNVLEIGVGGYKNPKSGGHSLRMWKRYFLFGRIFSIDIYEKSALQEKRIRIFQGSQIDKDFLMEVTENIGDIDIIIDDGSHVNEHVIESFKILFPQLKSGGIYVVEDTQTSYWKGHGGDSENLNNSTTMMNFFKSLTDGLNHKEFIRPGYESTYFDQNITSVHFYHNLIFIYKGNNTEESNLVYKNEG